MTSAYPENALRNLRDKIEILPLLKAINYRLDTIQEIGEGVKCFCPIHKEAVFRTLTIDRKMRRYRCSYNLCPGNKGGDLIDFYAKAVGIDYDDAVQQLIQHLKIAIDLPPSEDLLRKALEVAENYLALGAHNDALVGFKKVLATQPDDLRALKGLVEIHRARNEDGPRLEVLARLVGLTMQQGEFAQAGDYCREILEKRPNDAGVRLKYIECLIGQKEMHRALEEYMRLADYFESRQEFDRALEVYRKIEQLDLDIIDVYPHIIQVMVASDRTQDAVAESLRKAAEHEERGEYEQALECYRTTLEVAPERAGIRESLVEAAIRAGLNEVRIEECLAVVETQVQGEFYGAAVQTLEKMRRAAPKHIGIVAKYVDVLRRQGRDAAATEGQIDLIGLFLGEGRTDEAMAQLRTVSPSADLSFESLKRLAQVQRQCGLTRKAAETFAAIAERLAEQGQFKEAADVYGIVVEFSPDEVSHRNRQIDLYQRAGHLDQVREKYVALLEMVIARQKWEEADKIVNVALGFAPDDLEFQECQTQILAATGRMGEAQVRYMGLARRAVASQQWDVAKRLLQRILAAEPDNAETALLLADVGIAQGDPRVARDHLQKIAQQLLCRREYAQAKVVLCKSHEIAPDDVFTLVHLASVYGNLGEESQLLATLRDLVTAYVANGAYAKALEYCTAILDRDPENIWTLEQMIKVYENTDKRRLIPEVYLRLGRVYEKLDDMDRVQECYEHALEVDPTNDQARSDYIQFLIGARRFEAASKEAQTALANLSDQRRFAEAIQVAEHWLEHMSDDVTLRRSVVELCRKAGQQREFVVQCTQLINLHYQRNELAEVADLYRELLVHEPTNVTFRTRLIDALVRLKQHEEAIQQYYELASFYLNNNNYEDAETTLLEVLNLSPGDPHTLEMLVEVLIKQGRAEDAAQRARELSEIYVGAGENNKAAEVLRRVLLLDPNNREIRLWLDEILRANETVQDAVSEQCARAASYWQEGNVEAAIEAQREAVRLRPDSTALRRRLTEMLAGRTAAPAEALDDLLHVAMLRVEQGQYAEAMQALEEILVRDPSHYAARRLRAEVFAKMGDQKRALDELFRLAPSAEADRGSAVAPAVPPASAGRQTFESLQVVPDFTFDNFVVGDRNRFAHATALAVAKAPAMHYNPLFLYSDVGLGKTHLISAIANYIAEHQSNLRVLYTSVEEFTSLLVDAIENNTINAFRSRYKAADVLLVDDIQFLAGKERAQEEFFHIFNTLFQAKRQIVVTSDRPPRDIARLEKRLKSRFGSGIIVDIQSPDFETRAAILRKEIKLHGDIPMDNRLINLVAERIQTNVRELKGALKQILMTYEISHAEIDEALVLGILERYVTEV